MLDSSTVDMAPAPEATPSAPAAPSTPAPAAASPSAAPAPSAPAGSTSPSAFLEINERTKYLSKEDAVRGYQELQNTLADLKKWERLWDDPAKGGYGFANIKSVDQLVPILDHYLQLTQQAQGSAPAAAGAQPAGSDQLSPEWQQYIRTLQEKAGFVTKDDLQQLQQSIHAEKEEARVSAAVDHGTKMLAAELKEAGLPEDAELLKEVGNVVGAKMDNLSYNAQGQLITGSPVERFLNGNESERRAIIKEQFSTYLKFADTYAKSKDATYANQKTSALANTPRPLPQSGAPAPAPANPKSRGFGDPTELNRRVKAAMEAEASRLGG